jgi:hypothetical protein
MEKKYDLFERHELMPKNIDEIFQRYWEKFGDSMDYKDIDDMLAEVEANGYTFDCGLDAVPYGLRPIGTNITELEGYEDL